MVAAGPDRDLPDGAPAERARERPRREHVRGRAVARVLVLAEAVRHAVDAQRARVDGARVHAPERAPRPERLDQGRLVAVVDVAQAQAPVLPRPPRVERAVARDGGRVRKAARDLRADDAGEAAPDEPRRLERPHVPVAQPPKAAAAPRVDVAVAREDRRVLAAAADARHGEAQQALDELRRRVAAVRVVVDRAHGVDDARRVRERDERGVEPAARREAPEARHRHELVARGHAERGPQRVDGAARLLAELVDDGARELAPGHLRRVPAEALDPEQPRRHVGDGRLRVVVAERAAGVARRRARVGRRRLGRRRGELADLALDVLQGRQRRAIPELGAEKIAPLLAQVLERAPRRLGAREEVRQPRPARARAVDGAQGPVERRREAARRRVLLPQRLAARFEKVERREAGVDDPIRLVARAW